MPLASTEYENAALDACYGSGHAASWPSSFTVHLYDEDPREDGEEIVGDGYAAVTVTNNSTNFPAAASGVKTSVPIDFGTADGDWPTATWWLLKNASNGHLVECCQFTRPLDAVSGNGVSITLSIKHDPEAD